MDIDVPLCEEPAAAAASSVGLFGALLGLLAPSVTSRTAAAAAAASSAAAAGVGGSSSAGTLLETKSDDIQALLLGFVIKFQRGRLEWMNLLADALRNLVRTYEFSNFSQLE